MKPIKPSNRYSLAHLLVVVGLLALAFASGQWAIQSSTLDSGESFPWLFVPSIFMIKYGFLLAPLGCIGMTVAIAVFMLRGQPRPLAPIYFLGLLPFVVVVDESSAARYLILLAVAVTTIALEPKLRSVDPNWKVIASLCLAITLACYWLIFCICASAAC
ncbi:MAG: hypothetical protein AAGA30_10785 [Planctomycetota bacterium]